MRFGKFFERGQEEEQRESGEFRICPQCGAQYIHMCPKCRYQSPEYKASTEALLKIGDEAIQRVEADRQREAEEEQAKRAKEEEKKKKWQLLEEQRKLRKEEQSKREALLRERALQEREKREKEYKESIERERERAKLEQGIQELEEAKREEREENKKMPLMTEEQQKTTVMEEVDENREKEALQQMEAMEYVVNEFWELVNELAALPLDKEERLKELERIFQRHDPQGLQRFLSPMRQDLQQTVRAMRESFEAK